MPYLHLPVGKTIHYTDWTPSEPRATIVLSHGLGSSQNFYAPLVPGLLEKGYRCIAYDTTGAGRSSYTYVEQSVETLAEDLKGVMEGLGVSKAVVVGHSMAGMVVSHLAATYPELIQAAILVGPVYPTPEGASAFSQRIDTVATKGIQPLADTIPTGATSTTASPLVRAFIRELILGQSPEGYISNCRVITNAKRPAYEKIQSPVLMIVGEEDKAAPGVNCRKMMEEIGSERKKWVELKDCGHWIVVEKPEEVGREIVDFLGQVL